MEIHCTGHYAELYSHTQSDFLVDQGSIKACHGKIDPGKNSPAGPILDIKTGPGGPILVDKFWTSFGMQNWSALAKIGPGLEMHAHWFHAHRNSRV